MFKTIPRMRIIFPRKYWRILLITILKNKLITGYSVKKFEDNFSRFIGVKHAISMPSARIGLYSILKLVGIKKDDEIILSSYNTPIAINIITSINAKPIFVDINSDTLNIDSKLIEEKITQKTKAIIVLHAHGNPCEMDDIIKTAKKHNLVVIEDCAHALGSKYKYRIMGSIGDFGIFSFGIGKSINTLGGGMVVTNNKKNAEKIRKQMKSFRKPNSFNLIKKFILADLLSFLTNPIIFSIFVYPFLIISNLFRKDIIYKFFEDVGTPKIERKSLIKLSNFQALLGLEQLKGLEARLKKQRHNIDIFLKKINRKKIKFQKVTPSSKPVYLHFTLLPNNRSNLIRKLLWKGIDVQASWMKSCSSKNGYPISDMISEQATYIPIYPDLTEKDIKYVVNVLNGE